MKFRSEFQAPHFSRYSDLKSNFGKFSEQQARFLCTHVGAWYIDLKNGVYTAKISGPMPIVFGTGRRPNTSVLCTPVILRWEDLATPMYHICTTYYTRVHVSSKHRLSSHTLSLALCATTLRSGTGLLAPRRVVG